MEFLSTEIYEEQTKHYGNMKCAEEVGLKIPSLKTGQISLSDIIAATIGEDARFCDDGDVQAPEITTEDLNFSFYFKDTSDENITTTNSNDTTVTSNGIQYIHRYAATETDENSQHSTKFQKVPETDENSNTVDSFFKGEETTNNFTEEFNMNLGFETVFENHDDFLASLVQSTLEDTCDQGLSGLCANGNTTERAINLSGDSDLEDSIHFVDPDDQSASCKPDSDNETPEPKLKKRRLSDVYPMSANQYNNLNSCNSDLMSLLYAEENDSNFIHVPQRHNNHNNNNFNRRRSFSGAPSGRLSRQKGVSKLANNKYKTPTFQRTRSFSEAFNSEKLTPISEGRQLDTSLSSLLGSPSENSQLSNNPFYEDLKCTLLSDLSNSANDDCPRALFDTICQGQNSDVYARERNLQSRFSSLQSKYPDEVRDLSSFYRQQSAEVETERFREIHDERFPLSYRNHLNRYYDNLLHMIMERVEKSLQLLSKAKKEPAVTVVQGFRPRPLLSRKAVSMMEEWYTRNYEHPYPSQTAVEALAAAGEITTEQVKKWFANKRNRSKNTRPMNEVVGMKRKRQFSARW